MAGFRSLWGTLPAPASAKPGLVWRQLSSHQPLAVCPDGSTPLTLPQNRKLCHTAQHRRGCVVYSFGSNNDFSFEEAVLEQDERCKIHTFDPTATHVHGRNSMGKAIKQGSARLRAALSVHQTGLAHFDGLGDIPHPWNAPVLLFKMQTLPTLMTQLGHRHVHVLKIDTSGEMEVLHTLNASGFSLRAFDQVLMEIHLYHPTTSGERQRCCYGFEDVTKAFEIMRTHGFAVLSLQPASGRTFTPDTCCAEVAWVKQRGASAGRHRYFRTTNTTRHR
uniref:Methyltransferase domain-containing protein n=1 Tax=Emiliania huxleyi TaxID=2903 RepID=A0A7S3U3D1_EMIHU